MLKSMTAYGRACVISPLGRFSVEIQSVNRKHLEINTFLPKEFVRFDTDIKKWIALKVGRGQINVKVSVVFEVFSPLTITPNIPLAKQIKTAWDKIAQELNLPEDQGFKLDFLANESEILLYDENFQDEEQYRQTLNDAISQALEELIVMKTREGNILYQDIKNRLDRLSILIKEIALKAPGATQRYRQRLIERIEEVLRGSVENEERILREVSIYAERIDIAEELTRFESHLKQVDELIHSNAQGIGKTMEFLVQELNREINTIGSKSSDIEVARHVVDIKSELERIREQIQNVE